MGASIKLSATGTVLRKSGTLVLTKIAVAWVVAAIASRVMPENGVEVGMFAGLSTLALVAAMDMTNGGLYASIMQQYGSKEEAGAFVLMSLESGPLMTLIDAPIQKNQTARMGTVPVIRPLVKEPKYFPAPGENV